MGVQQHQGPKQKFNQQYMNWFDQRRSENSRYGSGWIDHVDGVRIADGIFRLIQDFEKGKISYDMYKDAFDSQHFITNACPVLDGRAREISIILNAINGALNTNSIQEADKMMVLNKKSLFELELNQYNTVSNALKAYGITKNRKEIDNMLGEMVVVNKSRRLIEDSDMINRYRSSGLTWNEFESSNKKTNEAKRIISQISRPKFSVSDFVNGLKKDMMILHYMAANCNENIKFIDYIQIGIIKVAVDELSKTYYNQLNRKKTAYEMVLKEVNTAIAALNVAYNTYCVTGIYTFPVAIEYNFLALQSKLVNSYKGIL